LRSKGLNVSLTYPNSSELIFIDEANEPQSFVK
jgi:hypothetical protein